MQGLSTEKGFLMITENVSEHNMLYVGLSRFKNVENLVIESLSDAAWNLAEKLDASKLRFLVKMDRLKI